MPKQRALDELALWQQSKSRVREPDTMKGRRIHDRMLEEEERERRRLKRTQPAVHAKLMNKHGTEQASGVTKIVKPDSFQREYQSLIERTNDAAAKERGKR